MLPGAPQPLLLSERSRPLVTAFRSPATAAPFGASIPGSKFPACYFASSPAASTARSALRLRYLHRFAPVSGRFLASGPLQLPRLARRTAPPASTPLRDFYLPPDQSVQLDSPPVGPPSESARFPLAPRRPFYLLGLGCGSPFPVRYVSGGLLFLKPLGTFFTMLPKPFCVNAFLCFQDTFSSIFIWFVSKWLQSDDTCILCG